MKRGSALLLPFLATLALAACGGSDDPDALPDVAAPAPPEARAAAERCLALVGAEAFGEALAACRDAHRLDPRNEELRAALEVARVHLAGP